MWDQASLFTWLLYGAHIRTFTKRYNITKHFFGHSSSRFQYLWKWKTHVKIFPKLSSCVPQKKTTANRCRSTWGRGNNDRIWISGRAMPLIWGCVSCRRHIASERGCVRVRFWERRCGGFLWFSSPCLGNLSGSQSHFLIKHLTSDSEYLWGSQFKLNI